MPLMRAMPHLCRPRLRMLPKLGRDQLTGPPREGGPAAAGQFATRQRISSGHSP
jgi:hypothetical protein